MSREFIERGINGDTLSIALRFSKTSPFIPIYRRCLHYLQIRQFEALEVSIFEDMPGFVLVLFCRLLEAARGSVCSFRGPSRVYWEDQARILASVGGSPARAAIR